MGKNILQVKVSSGKIFRRENFCDLTKISSLFPNKEIFPDKVTYYFKKTNKPDATLIEDLMINKAMFQFQYLFENKHFANFSNLPSYTFNIIYPQITLSKLEKAVSGIL